MCIFASLKNLGNVYKRQFEKSRKCDYETENLQ